jgi:hypothetical protein
MREEAGLLDDVADAPAQRGRVDALHRLAVEQDLSLGGVDHPVDHPERCRLPAAGRADEYGDLAGGRLQAETVNGDGPVWVAFGDSVERDHARPSASGQGRGPPATTAA